MKLSEMIKILTDEQEKYGGDLNVVFDMKLLHEPMLWLKRGDEDRRPLYIAIDSHDRFMEEAAEIDRRMEAKR